MMGTKNRNDADISLYIYHLSFITYVRERGRKNKHHMYTLLIQYYTQHDQLCRTINLQDLTITIKLQGMREGTVV